MVVVDATWVEYATHFDTSPIMGAATNGGHVQNLGPWIQMSTPNVTQCINQTTAPTISEFISQPIALSTS
jgi:hypothetical protein